MSDRNVIATSDFVMNGVRTSLELARYADDRFAMTGTYDGGGGQVGDRIREDADDFEQVGRLLDLWDAHHLKVVDDEAFAEASDLLLALDGERLGDAPDLDDAPDLSGDVLDSRDIVKALEIYRDAVRHMGVPDDVTAETMPEELDDDDRETVEEFIRLRDLDAEASGYASDWAYGSTLVADSEWVDWCEQYLKDVGILPDELPSWVAIDWEKTAEAVQQDYTRVNYGDREFWVR